MNDHEYTTYEKEALGVVNEICHFQYFFERTFWVFCHDMAVNWLFNQKNSSGKIADWVINLLEYSFTVTHKLRVLNGYADTLSRIPQVLKVVTVQMEDFEGRLRNEHVKEEGLDLIIRLDDLGLESAHGILKM